MYSDTTQSSSCFAEHEASGEYKENVLHDLVYLLGVLNVSKFVHILYLNIFG